LGRHGHVQAGDQVAAAGGVEARRAAAADAEQLAVLRAGRHLQGHRSVRRRHLHGRAERGLREGHRHVELQIGLAAPAVQLRRLDARDDEQVASRAAAVAGLALPAQLDPRPVLDARRDLHPEAAGAPLAPAASAARARLLDDGAVPAAARARVREGEQALRLGDRAAAAALRADGRRCTGLRARAVADLAGALEADGQRRLHTPERVLEGERDLDLDVRAALPAPTAPSAAHAPAEQAAEQVAEVAELAEVEGDAFAARAEADAPVRRAVGVVRPPLVRVGEDVVGGLQLLEALLGLLVARVLVRVIAARELAVRLLDLLLGGALGDAEDVVEAPTRARRHSALPPSAPRRRRGPAAARGRRAGSPSARPRSRSPRPPPTAARAAPRARAGRSALRPRSPRARACAAARRATGARAARPPRAALPSARRRRRALARGRRRSAGAPSRAARSPERRTTPGRVPPACGSCRTPP